MTITDIFGRIQVSISTMTTRTTDEPRLRRSVATIDMSADVAPLRRVSRIDAYYMTANRLSFVFKKRFELCERPRMQSSLRFSSRRLDSRSDVREVFNDNDGTGFDARKNALTENVIAIASEPLATARKVSKVPLGRLRTVRLQFSAKSEPPFFDFTPVLPPVHPSIGGYGRATNTEINPDRIAIRHECNVGQFDCDMERESPPPVHEIGGTNLRPAELLGVRREDECDFEPPLNSGEVDNSLLPIQFEGVDVVTRRAKFGMGALDGLSLLRERNSGFNAFSRFLSSLDMKVRHEGGKSFFTIAVGEFMQVVGVAVLPPPSFGANAIERFGELKRRFKQSIHLAYRQFKWYPNRSLHALIIPYKTTISHYMAVILAGCCGIGLFVFGEANG